MPPFSDEPFCPDGEVRHHFFHGSHRQVINSYYGIFAHADSYDLRRKIYLDNFGRLQDYFIPQKGFTKVELRPLNVLRREGIIAL